MLKIGRRLSFISRYPKLSFTIAFVTVLLVGSLIYAGGAAVLTIFESARYEQQADFDLNGGNLSPETLAWMSAVQKELKNQGLDPDEWTIYVLGIIEAESGGNASVTPDIMQASESQGLPPNSISSPEESIKVGVRYLSNTIAHAESRGITDKKAILQAYNFGTNFLNHMYMNNKKTWTIEMAEDYSINVVYPAVTGRASSTHTKRSYNAPWAIEVNKPYTIVNGGNFHYPNIVYHYISGAMLVGNFEGDFIVPYMGDYVVTSEFGMRVHPVFGYARLHAGIDLVGMPHKQILATADGVVESIGYDGSSPGHWLTLNHGVKNGKQYFSRYLHLASRPNLSIGQAVKQGQVIGREGNTGASTGPHLHFEIAVQEPGTKFNYNSQQNPRNFINFKPKGQY